MRNLKIARALSCMLGIGTLLLTVWCITAELWLTAFNCALLTVLSALQVDTCNILIRMKRNLDQLEKLQPK